MMLGKLKLLALVSILTVTSSLYGAGTISGTSVLNSAKLNYTIGSGDTAQAKEKSVSTTFVVDDKVNFIVATRDTKAVEVNSGAQNAVLTFSVKNEGNAVHDFLLTTMQSSATAFDGSVTNDSSAEGIVKIFVDSNNNNTYEEGVDIVQYIDELAPEAEVTVFVIANMKADALDGEIAVYDLQAQVARAGSSGPGLPIKDDDSDEADQVTTVQIVFADQKGTTDELHDGKHGTADAYKIMTATISIIKNSVVLEDPFNQEVNPKRIPGAKIRYCFIVENTGNAPASNAVVTDEMSNTVFDFTHTTVRLYNGSSVCTCDTAEVDITGTNGTDFGVTPTNNAPTAKLDFGTINAQSKRCGYVTAVIK